MGSVLWVRGRGPGPHAPTQPCRRAPGLGEERAGGSLGQKLARQALRASWPPVACCGVPMAMGYRHQRVEYCTASPRTGGSQHQAGRGEPGHGATLPQGPQGQRCSAFLHPESLGQHLGEAPKDERGKSCSSADRGPRN